MAPGTKGARSLKRLIQPLNLATNRKIHTLLTSDPKNLINMYRNGVIPLAKFLNRINAAPAVFRVVIRNNLRNPALQIFNRTSPLSNRNIALKSQDSISKRNTKLMQEGVKTLFINVKLITNL